MEDYPEYEQNHEECEAGLHIYSSTCLVCQYKVHKRDVELATGKN